MSREIKFRAWDKEQKYMFIIFNNSSEEWYLPRWKERYEVMQYTGQKTFTAGQEIWEDDVCSFNYDGKKRIERVCFLGGSFSLGSCMTIRQSNLDEHKEVRNSLEVIGNIHSNPELLKEA